MAAAAEWAQAPALGLTAMYTTARLQPFGVPHFIPDLLVNEDAVVHMTWDQIVAQPTLPNFPALHYVDYRSARLVFTASEGKVVARSFSPVLIN